MCVCVCPPVGWTCTPCWPEPCPSPWSPSVWEPCTRRWWIRRWTLYLPLYLQVQTYTFLYVHANTYSSSRSGSWLKGFVRRAKRWLLLSCQKNDTLTGSLQEENAIAWLQNTKVHRPNCTTMKQFHWWNANYRHVWTSSVFFGILRAPHLVETGC